MTADAHHIAENLMAAGVKPSAQRIAVMRHLMEHRTHPTVDGIYRSLQPDHPTLSRTTVYNSLKLLASAGLIKCIDTIAGEGARWDWSDEDHAHFICTRCGRVTDVEFPLQQAFPLVPGGYVVGSVSLNFRGLCAACAKEADHT